jgi:hypothetical protein
VKYLLISLSLWLCSYSASALEQDEFNLLIDNIKQKNFDVVEAHLKEEKSSATTDPDYTVLLLNYRFNKARTIRFTTGLGDAKEGDLELTSKDGQNTKGFLREEVSFDKPYILEAVRIAQNNHSLISSIFTLALLPLPKTLLS